jgi:NAD(P)-dependent dehydrogenase (short-subunit alcohol dehydrogenase family)
MDPISLEGQVAIVTGGGRGIGRAYCLELGRRGAAVVVNDIGREHAEAVVAEIEAAGGRAVPNDDSVATAEGGKGMVATAVERFGTLTAVVNNAGTMRNGYFEDQTTAMLESQLDVHLRGCWYVSQAAWPVLREAGYGRVVMTGSTAGFFAMQGQANYCAAKGGVHGLTKALAYEGREHGILVNGVLPAARTTLAAGDPVPDMDAHRPAGVAESLAGRRLPELVAPMITYLVSPGCNITGEFFAAGFGRFARVFTAEAPGWVAPDPAALTAEDVVAHLDDIRRLDGYFVPAHIHEETAAVAEIVLTNGG